MGREEAILCQSFQILYFSLSNSMKNNRALFWTFQISDQIIFQDKINIFKLVLKKHLHLQRVIWLELECRIRQSCNVCNSPVNWRGYKGLQVRLFPFFFLINLSPVYILLSQLLSLSQCTSTLFTFRKMITSVFGYTIRSSNALSRGQSISTFRCKMQSSPWIFR